MNRFKSQSKVFVTIKSHKEVKIFEAQNVKILTLRELQTWIRSRTFDSVYVHFLSNTIAYVLHKTQLTKLPCYWIMWGADFYGLPTISQSFYLPKSKAFAWKNNGWKQKLARFLGLPSSAYVLKVLKEIEFFVGYKEEFELTQKALSHTMKFVPWEYYFSIEELGMPPVNQGNGSILLGNSDDPMNNHIDVLEKLETVVNQGQRIIVPVAGAPEKYLNKLKSLSATSKAKIILQEKLLDSESFFKMMDEVSYVVYGHLRQQGVGTIIPLLYQGKKAFMWDSNPLKGTLERWGMKIRSIDKISSADFENLSDEEVKMQRGNLEEVLSMEKDELRWSRILR